MTIEERIERLVEFVETLGPTEEELDAAAEEEDRRFEAVAG